MIAPDSKSVLLPPPVASSSVRAGILLFGLIAKKASENCSSFAKSIAITLYSASNSSSKRTTFMPFGVAVFV